MRDWGLVFAGGGGKGAYQIGVWRALRRLGLDKRIGVVSGTSVGAINAALFAQEDLKRAKEVWTALQPDQILFPVKEEPVSTEKEDREAEEDATWIEAFLSTSTSTALFSALEPVASTLSKYLRDIKEKGLVPNQGLHRLLKAYLDPQKVIDSPIKCYATCMPVEGKKREAHRYLLGTYSPSQIPGIILASAAIPYVFPQVEIEGERFHDGGVPWEKEAGSDNIPIQPAYQEGCRTILVVHMGKRGTCKTLEDKFPGAQLIEVCPEKPMLLQDTLNFTHDFVMEAMEKGYKDGDFILEDYI